MQPTAMPSEVPPHSSPPFQSLQSPRPQYPPRRISLDFEQQSHSPGEPVDSQEVDEGTSPPHNLISPAFTPPSTPGSDTPWQLKRSKSIAVDSSTLTEPGPKLLDVLPVVECVVRARIPTTSGQEMFLHLYTNNIDNKEHLAIVFGPHIRSRSLDQERPGETEMDRMIRGAYTGKLFPGRTTSKLSQPQQTPPNESISLKANSETDQAPTISTPPTSNDTSPPPPSSSYHDASPSSPPLVRIHSECYTGETVWSARCDCGEQLDEAARLMSMPGGAETPLNLSVPASPTLRTANPSSTPSSSSDHSNPGGVIIYLRQEGRGIGLSEKLKAYNLQDLGSDTVEANLLLRHPADARSYGLATSMLVDLGLGGETGIRLLTNNPDKIRAVEGPGREVRVRERVAMVPIAWKTGGKAGIRSVEVESYLKTKIEQFGHMIENESR